jgi:hypothetical protein
MKIQFTAYVKHDLVAMIKIGLLSGIVGGFALFSSFFWIDMDLGVAPGTFYKMVGVVVGLHEMPAIIFGFFAHMITAAVIGMVFCVVSLSHKYLRIDGTSKGIVAGIITGIEVYALIFLPLSIYVMIPIAQDYTMGLRGVVLSDETDAITKLLQNPEKMLWGSLILHILYGGIMGLFSSIMLHEKYSPKSKNHR